MQAQLDPIASYLSLHAVLHDLPRHGVRMGNVVNAARYDAWQRDESAVEQGTAVRRWSCACTPWR